MIRLIFILSKGNSWVHLLQLNLAVLYRPMLEATAPAFRAAAKLSRLPAGTIISKSERFMGTKVVIFFGTSATFVPHL